MFYDIEQLKCELVNVTPDLAQQLVASTLYERQRPMSSDHIDRLATEMKKGRFIPGTEVHFAVVGRSMFMINGNHTIRAVVRSGVTLPLIFLYTDCERMADVDRLYARHDQHRARNWTATFKAHGMFADAAADAGFVTGASAGMRYILTGLDSNSFNDRKSEIFWSRDLRLDAMREYASEVDQLCAACAVATKRTKRLVRRAAFLAIGLETMRFQPSKASEFWHGVAADNGLKNGDPRKALLDWAQMNSVNGHVGVFESIRAASLAWNGFFEDRELTSLKPNAMGIYRLAGTPWKEGKRPEMECLKDKAPKYGLVKKTPPAGVKLGIERQPDGSGKTVAIPG